MNGWQVLHEYNKAVARVCFDIIWRQIEEEKASRLKEQLRWADDGGPLPYVDHEDDWSHLYAL